jgi:ATP-dependent exoDNAse (exonuclease V) beta subunit
VGEIYATQLHLLYVAATRARDFLRISGCEPLSEFVEDLVQD